MTEQYVEFTSCELEQFTGSISVGLLKDEYGMMYWVAQYNDDLPQQHHDIYQAILNTGVGFGLMENAVLIVEELGYKFDKK